MNTVSPLISPYPEAERSDATRSLRARDRYLARQIDSCAREHGDASVVSLFGPPPAEPKASMHAIIAKQYCLFDCGLVYLPALPDTIAETTLEFLLDSLVSWLRPGGELIVCAFTAPSDEAPLDLPADHRAGVKAPEQLLQLARNIDDAYARVHCEHADKLAFLHLRRQ
jgi:hypothetical protein